MQEAITLAIEFRIVRFVLLEHVVNYGEQHSCNGNDGFLVPPALFEGKVAISNFRKLLGADCAERTLNE